MRIRGPLPRLVVACVVLWCGVAACRSAPTPPAAPRTLTVSAAASLGPVYQQLADRFRASHPGVEVRLNLANSAQLAQQIVQGVPVDVFAAASADTMDVVSRAGRAAGPPVSFASNRLEIAVAAGKPEGRPRFRRPREPGPAGGHDGPEDAVRRGHPRGRPAHGHRSAAGQRAG